MMANRCRCSEARHRVLVRCVGLLLAATVLTSSHGSHAVEERDGISVDTVVRHDYNRQLLEDSVQGEQPELRVGDAGHVAPEEETFSVRLGTNEILSSDSLDFSSENDIPGSLWLPIGLQEVSSGDPWVTMCLMNYKKYQDKPSATPMFASLMAISRCGRTRGSASGDIRIGSAALVRMSSLMKSIEESGLEPVPPRGFIYHETRCGSTLVANMLASLPPSRVFSESKPPVQGIRSCKEQGCDSDTITKVLRNTISLMGRRRSLGEQHEHMYFKFQNSKFLPEITKAFPKVPWVFVFRDPVEVMVSNLRNLASGPCVRIPRQEKMKAELARRGDVGGVPGVRQKMRARGRSRRERGGPRGRERSRRRLDDGLAWDEGDRENAAGDGEQLASRGLVSGSGGVTGRGGWIVEGSPESAAQLPRGYSEAGSAGSTLPFSRPHGRTQQGLSPLSTQESLGTVEGIHDAHEHRSHPHPHHYHHVHPILPIFEDSSSSCSSTDFGYAMVWESEDVFPQEEDYFVGTGVEVVDVKGGLRGAADGDAGAATTMRRKWDVEDSAGAVTEQRSLLGPRRAFRPRRDESLSVEMCKECADWLKSMCDYAIEAGDLTPENALFVDYNNLPDAVPEHVFPVHFGMAAEMDQAVPNWKELMYQAAGTYSKGTGRTGKEFTGDVEAKHKEASPMIIEVANEEGGLYKSYETLDTLQTWQRP